MPLSVSERISHGFLAVVSAVVSARCLYVLGTRLHAGETTAVDLILLVLGVASGYALFASLYTLLRGRRPALVQPPFHSATLRSVRDTANRIQWWWLVVMCASVAARAIFFLGWKLYLGEATPAAFVAIPVGAAAAYCGYWLYSKKLKKAAAPPA